MPKIDTGCTISESVEPRVRTAAADEGMLSSGRSHENRRGWESVIDRQLIEWGRGLDGLECDDIRPPSAVSIRAAIDIARFMRDEAESAPVRVVPNGEGGIVFEWAEGREFETVEIDEEGLVEICRFVDSRLVFRRLLN